MEYNPHNHFALWMLSLCLAPLCIQPMIDIGTLTAYALVTIVCLFAGFLFVIGIVSHWRYTFE